MLAFGRALMSRPEIILMDEPPMGLPPIIVAQIMTHAREISELGIGMMAEQNAAAALRVADRVVVLNLGRRFSKVLPRPRIATNQLRAHFWGKRRHRASTNAAILACDGTACPRRRAMRLMISPSEIF
jgi:ABC-type branched-subunit amino acid transport system ATPase component